MNEKQVRTYSEEGTELERESVSFESPARALAVLSQDEVVAQYLKTKQLFKAAEEAKLALEKRIHEFLDHECGTLSGPGYVLTCKEITRAVTDYKAVLLAAGVPESVVAVYTKPSTYKQIKVDANL